ncbi:unnamed protein product, partial [Didymodactylos carnosus]
MTTHRYNLRSNKNNNSQPSLDLSNRPKQEQSTVGRQKSLLKGIQTQATQAFPTSTQNQQEEEEIYSTISSELLRDTLTNSSATNTIDLKMANPENFKQWKIEQQQKITVLEHSKLNTIDQWMEIIESVFTTLDYEEEIWATIVYRYLDQQLQDWYDQTKPSFLGSNDWNKFKELLTQYPVVPSWLSSTMDTVTSTSPSSNDTNSTTNDNNHAIEDKKLPTSLLR